MIHLGWYTVYIYCDDSNLSPASPRTFSVIGFIIFIDLSDLHASKIVADSM